MFRDSCSENGNQHFGIVKNLRTGEVPPVMLQIISIPNLIKGNGGIKIVLEGLNISKNRLRSAGDIEILIKIRLAHLF